MLGGWRIRRRGTRENRLEVAVRRGDVGAVRRLHEEGLSPAACHQETIRAAIAAGHWPVLHYLFQHGGQVTPVLDDTTVTPPRSSAGHPIINQARAHLAAARAQPWRGPHAGPRWETYSAWARIVIPHLRTPQAVTRFAQNATGHGGFESRQSGADLVGDATALEQHLAQRFPHLAHAFGSFTESPLSDDETSCVVNGRRVSGPMYTHATFFLECLTHLGPAPATVGEIGGGYGGPCRLWMTNAIHRPQRYVIIDLPESLFFAEVFLRHELGPERVAYVDSPTASLSAQPGAVILCPIPCLPALSSLAFDLVYNTLSMQEMSESYVAFYRQWLQAQPVRHFYSFNYAVLPSDEHPESANLGAPWLSADWQPVWIAPYAAAPSPAVHLLAEKREQEAPGDRTARGHRLLETYLPVDCDAVTFLHLLMAAGIRDDAHATCRVLDKVCREMAVLPREVWRLVDLARTQPGAASLDEGERALIAAAEQRLLERKAPEGRVSPHLEPLRDALRDGG